MWDTHIVSKHKCKYKTDANGDYALTLYKDRDSIIPQIFGGILIDAEDNFVKANEYTVSISGPTDYINWTS